MYVCIVIGKEKPYHCHLLTMKIILRCVPFLLLILFLLALLPTGGKDDSSQMYKISFLYSKTMGWLRGIDKGAHTSGKNDTLSSNSRKCNGIPLSPNLSSCHSSPSEPIPPNDPYHEVYCCPKKPHSGLITDFKFPSRSSPFRLRRPAHLLDEDYIAKYEKAVALMKQLPQDHPHSLWSQAMIHCLYCNGAYDQDNFPGTPFKVHRSWLFFPFHRLYIYFHERILGKLIGDDTFALPYWNWDSTKGMVIPNIYMKNGSLYNKARHDTHLPPAIADLGYDSVERGLDSTEQIASNLALMYHQMVSGAKKPELFMGCKLQKGEEGSCDGPGTIEIAPHNSLHSWVGNGSNPEGEDMGAFYIAARDPMFYAHHANIDRMWMTWKKLHDIPGPEFADSQWLDTQFYFYDENLDLVRVKVRDCLDIDKLRYGYEEADLPWLHSRPKPSVHPKVVTHDILRMPIHRKGPWILEKTVTTRITMPTNRRSEEEEMVLVVHGINVRKDMYVKFDVYVNVVDENISTASPISREYAGCFVKNRGEVALKGKTDIKLGISELLEDLEADRDESIWVSLVPRGGTGNVTSVDGILIEYMR